MGDTGVKWAYFDSDALQELGVTVSEHGKMPDAVIYHSAKNWLLLIEAVTSHGPVDAKRRNELEQLFHDSLAGLVFVTAFLNRKEMTKYTSEISWATEVWVAESPTHLIHFNGERFLGTLRGMTWGGAGQICACRESHLCGRYRREVALF